MGPRISAAAAALGSRTNRGAVERMDRLDEKQLFGYILVRAAVVSDVERGAAPGGGILRCGPLQNRNLEFFAEFDFAESVKVGKGGAP